MEISKICEKDENGEVCDGGACDGDVRNRKLEAELTSELVTIKTYIDSKSLGITSTVHHFENSANNFIQRAIRNIRCSNAIYEHLLLLLVLMLLLVLLLR